MTWFEKSSSSILQHRLFATYQLAIFTEFFLALLSFILLLGKFSSLSVFFGVLAALVLARIVYVYAIISLKKETKLIYGVQIAIQAIVSLLLYFYSSFYSFVLISLLIVIIIPFLTHSFCRKMKWLDA